MIQDIPISMKRIVGQTQGDDGLNTFKDNVKDAIHNKHDALRIPLNSMFLVE